MCKECFEYSEKFAHVMEDNQRLLEENRTLRAKLKESLERLNKIIELTKIYKESFSGVCGENTEVIK